MVLARDQDAIARARSERDSLLRDKSEIGRLAIENAELDALRATNDGIQKLILANKDLPRLRNDIRRLRQEAVEAAKLRGETQVLAGNSEPGGKQPDFVTHASLHDAGLLTPEATIQTFFYALTQGDYERMAECQGVQGPLPLADPENQKSNTQLEFAEFPGYQIAAMTNVAPDEVDIGVQTTLGGMVVTFKLKSRAGDGGNIQWIISEHTEFH